jgi:hypothetical protein
MIKEIHMHDEFGIFRMAEVDSGQCVFMGQVDITVGMEWRLISGIRAVATRTVFAQERIDRALKCGKRSVFVEALDASIGDLF